MLLSSEAQAHQVLMIVDIDGHRAPEPDDAHLIAAAPDLLRALKSMMISHGMHGPCRHNSCTECVSAYNQAQAAIAKAEGK